jgi:phosphonate transport system permease protein
MGSGVGGALGLLLSFFPPVLTPSYLGALGGLVVETLGMSLGAMTIAFALSLPLSLAAALRLPGSKTLLAVLTAFRAIPDLTLAVLCVILFGIGTGAGLVALTLYYTVAVTKIFADILNTAQRGPLEALSAVGASRLQVALFGLLPLKQADLLTYGAYEFESAVRASIIIGAVGGGGIGSELVGSLASFDFKRVTTQILALALVVGVIDRATAWLSRRPRWLGALIPVGAAAVVVYGPRFFAVGHAVKVFGAISPAWLAWPLRRLMELLRTIPEIVWGLLLIAVSGVGPTAGALALGIHSTGSLARLFADALDNAPRQPQVALAATGASPLVVGAFATLPLALGPLAAHALFRLEWNLRMATVLGLIGAGGVGQALYDAQQLFFYRQMVAYILITWGLVAAVDAASSAVRRRYRLSQSTP